MSDQNSDLTVLGWEEWVALPDLEIPAIVAKIDTGARTSALHAYAIEPFGGDKNPHVRFKIHPIPDRPEIEMLCSAKVADRREVTSSNGESELRYVIEQVSSTRKAVIRSVCKGQKSQAVKANTSDLPFDA